MKAIRTIKKLDKSTREWGEAAGEVNTLEQAWKDMRADARRQESKLAALGGALLSLDVGRKAGREALRKRLAETAPMPIESAVPTIEATARPPAEPERSEQDSTPEPAPTASASTAEERAPAAEPATPEATEPESAQEEPTDENGRLARERMEQLGRALEERGNPELAAAEDTEGHLLAMARALEERAWRNAQVGELNEAILANARQLDAWQREWNETVGMIRARREDPSATPEEIAGLMTAVAQRAEDAENEARALVARINETLETARVLASRDDRNNPDGSVLALAGEIEDRVQAIPAAVSEKRDEIFGAREALLAA